MPKVRFVEPTPNENAMKFTLDGKAIDSGSATFKKGKPTDNPLAQAVLAVEGVVSVFLLNDFATVIKEPAAHWPSLRDEVTRAIESV
jgi:hypothetical protein